MKENNNSKKDWIKTDDIQFILKKSETEFDVIDIIEYSDNRLYLGNYRKINVDFYSDDEILSEIKSYGYKSIEDLKSKYGEASNQIIAECIAEQMNFDENTVELRSEEEINNWLKEIGCDDTVDLYKD